MATMTNEQIEAKKQQLKQLAVEAEKLKVELVEAGAWPLDENDLDEAAGGYAPCGPEKLQKWQKEHKPTFR